MLSSGFSFFEICRFREASLGFEMEVEYSFHVGLNPSILSSSTHYPISLSTVAIGLFTDLFLYGLIVPILPFILSSRLSLPPASIQSTTSLLLASYAGASVLFSLPAGIITDKLPTRQIPFLIGLFALLASTFLFSIGSTVGILVLARVLQGMSAAVVWTVGLALVMDTVGSKRLGVTIGSIYSFITAGELIAPVLGGVVYDKAGSGAVFGMGFALLGVDFLMRLLVIEKKIAGKYKGYREDEDRGEEGEVAEEDEDEITETHPLMGNGGREGNESEEWKIPDDQPIWIRRFPILYLLSSSRFLAAQVVAFSMFPFPVFPTRLES